MKITDLAIPPAYRWAVGGLLLVALAIGSWFAGQHTATNAAKAKELERIQAGIQRYKNDDAKNKQGIATLKDQDREIDKTVSATVQLDVERLRDESARARARLPSLRCDPTVTLFGGGNQRGSESDQGGGAGPNEQSRSDSKHQVIPDPIDDIKNNALAEFSALVERSAEKIEARANALEAAEARNQ